MEAVQNKYPWTRKTLGEGPIGSLHSDAPPRRRSFDEPISQIPHDASKRAGSGLLFFLFISLPLLLRLPLPFPSLSPARLLVVWTDSGLLVGHRPLSSFSPVAHSLSHSNNPFGYLITRFLHLLSLIFNSPYSVANWLFIFDNPNTHIHKIESSDDRPCDTTPRSFHNSRARIAQQRRRGTERHSLAAVICIFNQRP